MTAMTEPEARLYVAEAERDGRFWFLRVRDRPELFTQVVRLDQAPDMVRDLIATWDETDPDSIRVLVVPKAPADTGDVVQAAKDARVAAEAAQARASIAIRAAARALVDSGLTVRDAGVVLGVTHQRVAQLVAEPDPDPADVASLMRWYERVVASRDEGKPDLLEAWPLSGHVKWSDVKRSKGAGG